MKKEERKMNFELDKYYIFYNRGIEYFTSLEELIAIKTILKDIKDNNKYIGIGFEYKNKDGIEGCRGIGAVDVIIRYENMNKFKWGNDIKTAGLILSKEQEEVFQNLIENL